LISLTTMEILPIKKMRAGGKPALVGSAELAL